MPQDANEVDLQGIPYDFGSVMHYDGRVSGFTYNSNQYAIIAKDSNYQNTMGQRNGPSFIDYKQVSQLFNKGISAHTDAFRSTQHTAKVHVEQESDVSMTDMRIPIIAIDANALEVTYLIFFLQMFTIKYNYFKDSEATSVIQ